MVRSKVFKRMTTFQNKENVMKNQDQTNNNNNLNDPTVANDPQAQVEDLPMSGEQEERIKGGATTASFNPGVLAVVGDTGPQKLEIKMTDVMVSSYQTGGRAQG
jgi:ribonuclease BN (tRNA processing enzyme)